MKEYKNADEQKLIQRLVRGDEIAFELLFYRYRGKVGNFIRRSLPPDVDLEETVHEVFLRIWMNRSRLDPQLPFGPYLFKVARNRIIDVLRKQVMHTVYLQDESFLVDFGLNDTELKIEEKELQNWLQRVLEKLPEKRRNIFTLHRFEGLSYKEIALKLNISENTVDTQIRRTLQYFREELNKIRSFLLLLF